MVFYFFRLESFSQCYIIDIVSQLKENYSINFVSSYNETMTQSNVVDIPLPFATGVVDFRTRRK